MSAGANSQDRASAALIGIPSRYMHTPVEVVALKDAEAAARLLAALAAELPEDIEFIPG
ncbi:unnamed protein product [marine sediment metagenome]|uniref:Peptidase M42 family protein n=1 Tax=marine sediment metagenome TaxID=412755 RepID=X0WB97_9ZZZZ